MTDVRISCTILLSDREKACTFSETVQIWDLHVPPQGIRRLNSGITSLSASWLLFAIGQRLSSPPPCPLPPGLQSLFQQYQTQNFQNKITVETLREPTFKWEAYRNPATGYSFLGSLSAITINPEEDDDTAGLSLPVFSMDTTSSASQQFINTWKPTFLLDPAYHFLIILNKEPLQAFELTAVQPPAAAADALHNLGNVNPDLAQLSSAICAVQPPAASAIYNSGDINPSLDELIGLFDVSDHFGDALLDDSDVFTGEPTLNIPFGLSGPPAPLPTTGNLPEAVRVCGVSPSLWAQAAYLGSNNSLTMMVNNVQALSHVLEILGLGEYSNIPHSMILSGVATNVITEAGWVVKTYEKKAALFNWAQKVSAGGYAWSGSVPEEGSPDHHLYTIWVGIQWLFAPLSRCAPFSELVAPRPTANGFEERCAAALTQNKLFKNRSKLEQLVTFDDPF